MGQWVERRSMPTARHDLQAIAVGDSIFVISGADDASLDTVEIYDAVSQIWTMGPPVSIPRGWFGAAFLNGKIYTVGGKTIQTSEMRKRTGVDFNFLSRDTLEVFDSDLATWSLHEPMSGGPRAGAAVTACSGRIWVIGGNTMGPEQQRLLDRVEIYDPLEKEWSLGPSLPKPVQGSGVANIGGRIFVIGGMSGTGFSNEVLLLDRDSSGWRRLAPMPTARESMGIAFVNERVYTFGGRNGDYLDTTEVYDILHDSWTADTPRPVGKAWLGACAAGGRSSSPPAPTRFQVEGISGSTTFMNTNPEGLSQGAVGGDYGKA